VNGVPVRREKLQPGEFLFNNVPATVGLGETDIFIRDAFGVERMVSRSSFYYSDSLLKKGLQEYSYSLGFVREDLGEKSFSYGAPAVLAFHSYGFSDNVKAGYALEASNSLINIGPTATFLIPGAGVVDGALAVTSSEGKAGMGAFFGYSFRSRRLDVGIAVRALTREFSNLTIKPSDRKPSFEYGGTVGWTTESLGSISFEYAQSKMHFAESTSRMVFSYNKILTKNVTFFTSASRTDDGVGTDNQLFLGLHMYFGKGISGSINYTAGEDQNFAQASVQKSLPVGTGFGFIGDVQKDNGTTNAFGDIRYQNDYGIYGLTYRRLEGSDQYAFSASGGIGYIGKSFFLSRPILDGFAKVSVNGLEGVRVYHFGNEVGKTDRDGELIIPVMNSYIDNKIDIENRDIPIDYSIPKLTRYVSPPLRGGAHLKFDITKIQGITGQLFVIEKGSEAPAEFGEIRVFAKDKTITGLIGKNGEFYIENVPPGKHPAAIVSMQKECNFDIIIPESGDMWLDLGGVRCTIEGSEKF
jgi:outer membrane usher protein